MIEQQIQTLSNELFDQVLNHRKHIHQHPELSYQEFETANYVEQQLKEIGITEISRMAETGVIAVIRANHHDESASSIGLRADLDALPIQEEREHNYRSIYPGKMHACGHDVHTSILLGTAEILFRLRQELPQPVKLIFQPGEEKNPGGASLLIEAGVLENPKVQEMYALHVFPDLEVGKLGFKSGLYMASCDEIYMTIKGKGGHAATPHQCIDPIYIGAQLVVSLQQIVSRKCDPKIPCVLSFGHFEGIGATNVIPSQVHIKGTFRTMDETWRAEALKELSEIAHALVKSMGAELELEISKGYPYLENDPVVTDKLRGKVSSLFSPANIVDLPIRLTSEDFAFYSQKIPVSFFRLGVGNKANGITYGVHHPMFDIDEQALLFGMQAMSLSVF